MKARYDLILSLDFIDTYERSCHLICVVAFKISIQDLIVLQMFDIRLYFFRPW